MKRLTLLAIIAFAFSSTIGFSSTDANAEDVEFQVASYIVNFEFLPVPDVDKHAIGTFERRGVAIFKDGETAAYHTRGTWDFVDSNGPFQGYSTMTYKDGSTTSSKYTGTMNKEPEMLPTYTGKGEWIKGTGKYEGIKGNFSYNGYYITPYNKETKGDVVINVKGSYTLSK